MRGSFPVTVLARREELAQVLPNRLADEANVIDLQLWATRKVHPAFREPLRDRESLRQPIRRQMRNRRKEWTRLNALRLERRPKLLRRERRTVVHDRAHHPLRRFGPWKLWLQRERKARKTARILGEDALLDGLQLPRPLHLRKTHRGLERGHAIVEPDDRVPVAALGIRAVSPQLPHASDQIGIVRRDHPPLAGGHHLVAVEAEYAGLREPAHATPLVACSVRFRGVLDQRETVLFRDRGE